MFVKYNWNKLFIIILSLRIITHSDRDQGPLLHTQSQSYDLMSQHVQYTFSRKKNSQLLISPHRYRQLSSQRLFNPLFALSKAKTRPEMQFVYTWRNTFHFQVTYEKKLIFKSSPSKLHMSIVARKKQNYVIASQNDKYSISRERIKHYRRRRYKMKKKFSNRRNERNVVYGIRPLVCV